MRMVFEIQQHKTMVNINTAFVCRIIIRTQALTIIMNVNPQQHCPTFFISNRMRTSAQTQIISHFLRCSSKYVPKTWQIIQPDQPWSWQTWPSERNFSDFKNNIYLCKTMETKITTTHFNFRTFREGYFPKHYHTHTHSRTYFNINTTFTLIRIMKLFDFCFS